MEEFGLRVGHRTYVARWTDPQVRISLTIHLLNIIASTQLYQHSCADSDSVQNLSNIYQQDHFNNSHELHDFDKT